MTTNPPQQASDFTSISKPGGICHICSQPGVVLAYDIFAPKTGMWFCAKDWQELHYTLEASFLQIVEDKREKDDLPGLPEVVADKINVANAERDWHEKGSE